MDHPWEGARGRLTAWSPDPYTPQPGDLMLCWISAGSRQISRLSVRVSANRLPRAALVAVAVLFAVSHTYRRRSTAAWLELKGQEAVR